jgi:predicted dehydrogenase
MHTLLFYEPGHFHAALTLRNDNPRVASDVHLYARPGPDREAFLSLIDAFNSREARSTHWRVHLHEADDPLSRLIDERRGTIVVLAGRNGDKLATLARLHEAGFEVLADKPWLTSSAALTDLSRATDGPPLAMDIMTDRNEVVARLRHRLVRDARLFGEFVSEPGRPAIEIASVHHLYKMVNGRPLQRPWWYYDIAVQGDGVVDIQSHLTDQVQWLVLDDEPGNYGEDVELHAARRWTTPVPLDLFRDSTGRAAFPESLDEYVRDDVLALACNSEIEYSLRGVRARQRAQWEQREAPGGGDLHPCVIRGTRCTLVVKHGPETAQVAQLHVQPAAGIDLEPALAGAVAELQEDFPGVGLARSDTGFELTIPETLRTSHESHFAMVLEQFLDYVDAGRWPPWLTSGIRMRYQLLADARERALG